MPYYIDDLGLEYPELDGGKPPHSITLNPECSRSKGVLRVWNFRPNIKRRITREVEDSGAFIEQDIVYPSDIQWRNGSPLFTGTGSQVEICDAHNIREYNHRGLHTWGFTIEADSFNSFQTILSASGGHIQVVVRSDGGVNINRDSQATLLTGTAGLVTLNKRHRLLYVYDGDQTIDGSNRHFVYVDGADGGSSSTAASYSYFTVPFGIGAKHNNASAWNGTIDNVVLWDRGLSPAERVADARSPTDIYMTK